MPTDSVPLIAISDSLLPAIGKAASRKLTLWHDFANVKHLPVLDKEEPLIIKEASHIASTGRPGPVVIDILDIQQAVFKMTFPAELNLPGYQEDVTPPSTDAGAPGIGSISNAKRPAMSGVVSFPVMLTRNCGPLPSGLRAGRFNLMGLGVFDAEHPLSLYWFGMHGTVAGNWAICDSTTCLRLSALTTGSPVSIICSGR